MNQVLEARVETHRQWVVDCARGVADTSPDHSSFARDVAISFIETRARASVQRRFHGRRADAVAERLTAHALAEQTGVSPMDISANPHFTAGVALADRALITTVEYTTSAVLRGQELPLVPFAVPMLQNAMTAAM